MLWIVGIKESFFEVKELPIAGVIEDVHSGRSQVHLSSYGEVRERF